MESYQKIQQKYNKEVKDILNGYVVIEEKVDGSQFRIEVSPEGVIKTASKNIELGIDSMFKLATDIAENIFAGYKPLETTTIFCEYLKSVKHNTLAYGRVPNNHLVLFDVRVGDKYLDRMGKEDFAKQFNLEVTPALYRGDGSMITDDTITEMVNQMSFLGNTKMEGIVIKAYDRFYDVNLYPYLQGHWMCCKVVRPEFKEVNGDNQVTVKGEVEKIKAKYTTEARYIKAIQHLTEQGLIKNDMSDLKYLFPEVQKDLIAEEAENINNDLYKAFIKDIERGCTSGLVEFYKKRLQEIGAGATT